MSKPGVAMLWDESFLWALMAYRSFCSLGLSVEIVLSEDVRKGRLEGFDTLFVPGGWASDKTRALGEEGARAIRSFVESGGSYLGFCGGAGLALDVKGGLALTRASRVPTGQRVPSFSGGINLEPADTSHPIWSGISAPYTFQAWWPGQFHLGRADGVDVLASYGKPGGDFALADLPASDVELYGGGWDKWEGSYGINLDPGRLKGEPAIIEAGFGRGRVMLSYLHLETPGSRKGNRALVNAVGYLGGTGKRRRKKAASRRISKLYPVSAGARAASREMMAAAREFIEFGRRNFLWYWRNDWILQWRRGVRGVEYSMLYVMIKEIYGNLKMLDECREPGIEEKVTRLRDVSVAFFEGAKRLLLMERFAMMHGSMSSISSHDPEVERLRERLFSGSKRFGGEFKALLDMLDYLLLRTTRL